MRLLQRWLQPEQTPIPTEGDRLDQLVELAGQSITVRLSRPNTPEKKFVAICAGYIGHGPTALLAIERSFQKYLAR
jgi:hypothetical protein